ncbi:MAG: hypothetical protein C5S49_04155 [Candidatus Methanogaster sp.]|nr:MAG: hypothetical protein C5S49_04155 [ANME-2 cluster archaeon]
MLHPPCLKYGTSVVWNIWALFLIVIVNFLHPDRILPGYVTLLGRIALYAVFLGNELVFHTHGGVNGANIGSIGAWRTL